MRKILVFLFILSLPLSSFAESLKIKATADINAKIIKGTINGKPFIKVMQGDGHDFMVTGLHEQVSISSVELEIALPKGYTALAEADKAVKTAHGYNFTLKNANIPMILAISDRWQTKSIRYRDTELAVYFGSGNIKYADLYLEKLKTLNDRYVKLFGEYPFGRFAVADVPSPVGHALTSLTFISEKIVPMPFMLETSLGHEFLHQWMGIAVETVPEAGNWAEALTAYLADNSFEEERGKGAEYRKNALLTVMQYTGQKENGTCLLGFEYNRDKKSQAVGYSKGLMVFEMLKTLSGDKFDDALRLFYLRNKFKSVSWDEVQRAFEDATGKKLGGFFDGWLSDTALAEFDIDNPHVKGTADGFSVTFSVKNRYEWLNYPLEITVKTEKIDIQKTIYIDKKAEEFRIETDARPLSMVIDGGYKTARYLDRDEVYPVLHGLFSDKKKSIFVSDADKPKYGGIIDMIDNAVVYNDDVTAYNKTDKTIIILGNDRLAEKFCKGTARGHDFSVEACLLPVGTDGMVYVIDGKDAESVRSGFARLSHYGKFSRVSVDGGRIKTDIAESDRGIRINLYKANQGAKVEKMLSIKEIVEAEQGSATFFIGESHTSYAHHLNQLELIKSLKESGKKPAVGLEMVQYPYQKYLDDYIGGKIDEKEMLKGIEYYDRWKYDFRMYRPIFKYARENAIPLIALNTPTEITKKVSKGGLKSLSDEEVKNIPQDIVFSGGRYMDYLKEVFSQHKMGDFGNFYEAQILWDETMAQKAAEYIKLHPDKTLAVLAGNGHISHREAVPERFARMSGLKYTAMVQDEQPESGIADYVLYPAEMSFDESPKMGVALEDMDGRLTVKEITEKSPAEKAGVKAEDILLRFAGSEIKKMSDLKLELLYASQNREYELAVLRKGKETMLKIEF